MVGPSCEPDLTGALEAKRFAGLRVTRSAVGQLHLCRKVCCIHCGACNQRVLLGACAEPGGAVPGNNGLLSEGRACPCLAPFPSHPPSSPPDTRAVGPTENKGLERPVLAVSGEGGGYWLRERAKVQRLSRLTSLVSGQPDQKEEKLGGELGGEWKRN